MMEFVFQFEFTEQFLSDNVLNQKLDMSML